jgi:uncharacterized lipoprotein YehR (DUF1307 family)
MAIYDMAYKKEDKWRFAELDCRTKKQAQKLVNAMNEKNPDLEGIVVTFRQFGELKKIENDINLAKYQNWNRVIK